MLGENLEARYYTDPDVFQDEKRRVFQATWQVVAPLSAFADKGDYVAVDIAGTKIFVIRDESGSLRAFRNLCRHRGAALLTEGAGRCRSIRCPYHNWVYRLDGSLERSRSEVRIEARFADGFLCLIRELELELPPFEELAHPPELNLENGSHVLSSQRSEEDSVVDSVEELGSE